MRFLTDAARSVLSEERGRRVYWNGGLTRSEESSSYRPARKLWRRERDGHYVPSHGTRLRIVNSSGAESFQPLRQLLRIGQLDELGSVTGSLGAAARS